MNLVALIATVRTDADDFPQDKAEKDALMRTADIIGWLNEAEEEACIRKNLIFEGENEDLCVIDVDVGQQAYPLSDAWHLITRAWLTSEDSACPVMLNLCTRDALDRRRPDWRTHVQSPTDLIVYDTKVEFGSPLAKAWTLHLEGYRLPIKPMANATKDSPEIARPHHLYLRHWALHRGYSVPDSQLFNPDKAAKALAEFERYFGARPDADLRKDWYSDDPHTNTAVW